MEPSFPRSLGRAAHFRSVPLNARRSVRGPQSMGVGRSRIGVAIRCGMLKWPYRDRASPSSDAVTSLFAVPARPLCHHRARAATYPFDERGPARPTRPTAGSSASEASARKQSELTTTVRPPARLAALSRGNLLHQLFGFVPGPTPRENYKAHQRGAEEERVDQEP